jgi:hypothetical protein
MQDSQDFVCGYTARAARFCRPTRGPSSTGIGIIGCQEDLRLPLVGVTISRISSSLMPRAWV